MKLQAARTILASAAGLGVAIASVAQPALANEYSERFRATYLQTCRRDAQRAGLPAGMASQVCQCTLDRLQERFSETQLRNLMQRAQQTGNAPSALTEIGRSCAVEVLR